MTSAPDLAVRLGWVSLFQDLGSKMTVPLVPLFLAIVLDASPVVVGLVDGLAAAMVAVSAPAAGRLAMRTRPERLVRVGYGLSSLMKLALAGATGWVGVLVIRMFDRLGKGLRDAPRDLLLVVGDRRRVGRRFGIQQAMDKLGGMIGPLAGIAVYELTDESFTWVFVAAFVPSAISFMLLFRLPAVDRAAASKSSEPRPQTSRTQRLGLGLLGLHGFASVPVALLIVRAVDLGVGVSGVLGAFSLHRALTAAVAYPAGAAVDRIGPTPLVVAAMGSSGLALLIATESSVLAVWFAFALLGAAEGLGRGATKLWLVRLGPPEASGAVLGDRSSIGAVAGLVAGVFYGAVWIEFGRLALSIGGAASISVAVATALWRPRP